MLKFDVLTPELQVLISHAYDVALRLLFEGQPDSQKDAKVLLMKIEGYWPEQFASRLPGVKP